MRAVEDSENLPTVDFAYHLNLIEAKSEIKDPFAQGDGFVKSLSGTSPNFKRKVTNEIKKHHHGASGVESKQLHDLDVVTGYDVFGVVAPPHNLETLAKIYEASTPHYSAVNAKVSNIVGLGFKLVETNKTKRSMETITDEAKIKKARQKLDEARDELYSTIDDLNVEETFTEVMMKVWTDYEVMGNGYLEIGRNRDGTIGYIGHIPAQTMRVRRKLDGFVQISANKAQYFRNFGDQNTRNPVGNDKPNEVLHIKRYSPGNSFYGVPDIVAAQQAIAGNEFSSRFNLEYFENKAVPRHLITLKGANLGSAAQQELLTFFETGLRGQNHRSLFIPLPPDDANNKVEFNIEPIEAGTQDASFNNYRKSNMNEILMAHRVPVTKVSTGEGASLAIARDADKTFKEQVCQPQQKILEKKLNRVIKEFGDAFELKLNEMTLTDADTQSKIDERMVKAGIWTPNEPRVRDGMPSIKGGDERVDLNAANKIAQAKAEETTTRQRDSERSANSPDTSGEARQPKGDGRVTG